MNCNEFHQRLDDALERHQSIDVPELKPHSLECSECRSVWEDCLLLEPQVDAWNRSALREVDLVDTVVEQLHTAGILGGAADPRSSSEPQSRPQHKTSTIPARSNRPWLVVALSVVCVAVAIVFAFVLNPQDPQIANNDKQHVVPDDASNGPFNNQKNIIELNPDDIEVALLNRREVDDMVSNAQTGFESLGDSVRKQVTEISSIVPSNFDVWDAPENEDSEPDQTGSEPNPWLQRLFDTAEAFEAETT